VNFDQHARAEAQTLIEKLSSAAREDAEARAAEARLASEKLAEEKLTAALAAAEEKLTAALAATAADAAAKLAAAAADAAAKLEAARADAAKQADKALAAAHAAAVADAKAQVDAARADATSQAEKKLADALTAAAVDAAAQAESARQEASRQAEKKLAAALAEAAARAEAARVAATQQADKKLATALVDAASRADAARGAASQQLAAAQGDITALRAECDRQQKQLDEAHDQVRAADDERAQLLLSLEELRAQLATEIEGGRTAARAHQKAADDAEAAAGAFRRELESAAARIQALESTLADTAGHVFEQSQAVSRPLLPMLDNLASAIRDIHRATKPNDILEGLLEHIGDHFEQAAIFYVGRSVRGWRSRRFGVTSEMTGVTIPDAVATFVARVVSEREPQELTVPTDATLVGLASTPIAGAVALPLSTNGRVLAVIYAENARDDAGEHGVEFTIAKILVEQATRRLTKRPGANGSATQYAAARQARRVKLQAAVDITLDGSASFLVDLSSLGAQVLSPLALRPNRLVEMELVGAARTVQCKGRVVWALFEQQKGAAALYRAGVQFTDVDSHAVDSFLAMQGVPPEVPRAALNMPEPRFA
jgi:hypothetical protein